MKERLRFIVDYILFLVYLPIFVSAFGLANYGNPEIHKGVLIVIGIICFALAIEKLTKFEINTNLKGMNYAILFIIIIQALLSASIIKYPKVYSADAYSFLATLTMVAYCFDWLISLFQTKTNTKPHHNTHLTALQDV